MYVSQTSWVFNFNPIWTRLNLFSPMSGKLHAFILNIYQRKTIIDPLPVLCPRSHRWSLKSGPFRLRKINNLTPTRFSFRLKVEMWNKYMKKTETYLLQILLCCFFGPCTFMSMMDLESLSQLEFWFIQIFKHSKTLSRIKVINNININVGYKSPCLLVSLNKYVVY